MSKLTQEQRDSIDSIRSWLQNCNFTNKKFYTLGGGAGTGKTFIITHLAEKLGLKQGEIAYCAYTGKAALNLKKNGLQSSTIHRLIYIPKKKVDPVTGLEYVEFIRQKFLPYMVKLIVVDESSMVTEEIHDDILRFNKPILYVGDHYQLPPIGDKNFNLMKECDLDFKLEKIHRQASKSKIIQISIDVRNGKYVSFGDYGEVKKIKANELTDKELLEANQVICGKNDSRSMINGYYRGLLGHSGLPKKNERLIVNKNNYKLGVINGQQIQLLYDAILANTLTFNGQFIDMEDTKDVVKLLMSKNRTLNFSTRNFMDVTRRFHPKEFSDRVDADFAYAITCHKAQGSEWDKVILFDDGFGSWNAETRRRWLYTAITRASEELIWVVK